MQPSPQKKKKNMLKRQEYESRSQLVWSLPPLSTQCPSPSNAEHLPICHCMCVCESDSLSLNLDPVYVWNSLYVNFLFMSLYSLFVLFLSHVNYVLVYRHWSFPLYIFFYFSLVLFSLSGRVLSLPIKINTYMAGVNVYVKAEALRHSLKCYIFFTQLQTQLHGKRIFQEELSMHAVIPYIPTAIINKLKIEALWEKGGPKQKEKPNRETEDRSIIQEKRRRSVKPFGLWTRSLCRYFTYHSNVWQVVTEIKVCWPDLYLISHENANISKLFYRAAIKVWLDSTMCESACVCVCEREWERALFPSRDLSLTRLTLWP